MEKEELSDKYNQLQRQVERGELFTHTVLSHHSIRINEVESFLYAIIDLLTSKGMMIPDEILKTVASVKQEMLQTKEISNPGFALREHEQDNHEFTPVNCDERLHICKAVCCKLDFALSVHEVESGNIKWDLGRPYFIRHENDCYCSHVNRENLGCQVYHTRPSVCKKYSCAGDKRIWKNFEKMELNDEWIDANLKENKPVLRASMLADQKVSNKTIPGI